jgi:hypothetical protein
MDDGGTQQINMVGFTTKGMGYIQYRYVGSIKSVFCVDGGYGMRLFDQPLRVLGLCMCV